ncbi:hypothetical protein BKI52_38720 [marine bacterium AO1-C]|nr:hypothetical protein BKI52_38720 [marine bacterium AO1-C]
MSKNQPSLFYGYALFIKQSTALTDLQVLKSISLEDYKYVGLANESYLKYDKKKSICLTECKNWVHVLDNKANNLWQRHQYSKDQLNVDVAAQIGRHYEVFVAYQDHATNDFGFAYYRKGKLKRKYSVAWVDYEKLIDFENYGSKLPGEKNANTPSMPYVLHVAQSIGIDIRYNLNRIRVYAKR